MERHRWEDDICIRCGVKRKRIPLTKNLLLSRWQGRYFYEYFINGKLIDKQTCNQIKVK